MTVETGNTISNLKPGSPLKSDPKSQGDDHIRVIKHILQTQFPDGVGGSGFKIPLTATTQQFNWLSNVSADVQGQFTTLGNAIGESGLLGAIKYNKQLIDTNITAIGNASSGLVKKTNDNAAAIGGPTSGLTKAVADNTAELADLDLTALKDQVATNKSNIASILGRLPILEAMIITASGSVDGATGTLTSTWGSATIKSCVRQSVGVYVITFNAERHLWYQVVAVCNGAISAHRDSRTQFTLEARLADGSHYDPPELMFMVIH